MMKEKDARVEACGELLRGIREVKMYGWSDVLFNKIVRLRKGEVKFLSRKKYLDAVCVLLWASTPVAIALATFVVFALVLEETMDIATVFTSLSLLGERVWGLWVLSAFSLFTIPR